MTPSSNGNCSCDCVNCGRSAICPTCDKLLTWSEPDEHGDIRAGDFTIEKSLHWHSRETMYTSLLPSERQSIGRFTDIDAAKLACENHARKMLGWDV